MNHPFTIEVLKITHKTDKFPIAKFFNWVLKKKTVLIIIQTQNYQM